MINDEYIINKFWANKISVLKRYIKTNKITDDELEYLTNRYSDSSCIEESLYRIKHNIEVAPTCKTCGKKLSFINIKGGKFQHDYCSYKCMNSNEEKKQKIKDVVKEKYGVENISQLQETRIKVKNTIEEKYGVENISQLQETKNKIRETWDNHTNEYSKEIEEKKKTTCLKKYGVENVSQNDIIKDKIKETSLQKYGVIHHMKTQKSRKLISDLISSYDIQQKTMNTKRKNGTFNTSKPEEDCYIMLLEKYPDVIRQYKSELYPFNCDFYIPIIDTYIEYNGSWTHGGHPFNENNHEDIDRYNHLINCKSHYNKNAAYNWRYRDVKKRETAKQNWLNYIEFWNINDVKEWLSN